MKLLAIFLLLVAAVRASDASPWTWRCESGLCKRYSSGSVADGMQLNSCKLTCGELSVVWPRPTGPATFGKQTVPFIITNITFSVDAPDAVKPMLNNATDIFLENLQMLLTGMTGQQEQGCTREGDCREDVNSQEVEVVVTVEKEDTMLTMETDESYRLFVNRTAGGAVSVWLNAPTFFGGRHALETLSQLINYDDQNACLQILDSASITDAPVYPYRAITLDTARNFISLAGLRRTIDAMAMNKLNTLHWHITDTHSFPIEISGEPNLTQYGAYSPQQVYKQQDVKDLVQYGRQRGMRLLPELDAPAHVGYGWQWGEDAGLGKLAVCVGKEPWESYCVEPPCGQMNIINDNMYTVLQHIYEAYEDLFQPDIFHMGGDEINFNCWKNTSEIFEHVKLRGGNPEDTSEYMKLWTEYQVRAAGIWGNVSGRATPLLVWSSDLTKQEATRHSQRALSTNQYIVQVWTTAQDQHIGDLLQSGFPIILSNYDAWYLDCGFSAWVGAGHNWCTPYKSWQTVYDNSPRAIARSFQPKSGASDYTSLVRGGSAALWSEQADDATIDSRLWPRAAALAERLWAEPETGSAEALTRLVNHRQRMVERGVAADRMQPEYCHQNDGTCILHPVPSGGSSGWVGRSGAGLLAAVVLVLWFG